MRAPLALLRFRYADCLRHFHSSMRYAIIDYAAAAMRLCRHIRRAAAAADARCATRYARHAARCRACAARSAIDYAPRVMHELLLT